MRGLGSKRWALALCGLAALGTPAALAACGGSGGSTTPKVTGHKMTESVPGQIDSRPHGFTTTDLVTPVVNAWRVSSPTRLTEVAAGAFAPDHSIGVLAIFRHQFVSAHQESDLVKVVGSGPLRITHAPLGRKIVTSAQRNGEIRFVGARGVRGTLHLRDDTVSLLPPRP